MRVNPSISPRHAKALPNPIVGTQHNKKAALETIERDLFVCQIYIYIYICLPAFLSIVCCLRFLSYAKKESAFCYLLIDSETAGTGTETERESQSQRQSLPVALCLCSLPVAAKLPEILHSLILCRIKVNASSHLCVFFLCLRDLCQNIGSYSTSLSFPLWATWRMCNSINQLLLQLLHYFASLLLTLSRFH